MSHDPKAIRALALAIIKNDQNQILVSPGYDKVKNEHFFRLLGGGIDLGEYSLEALKREFKEELNADLTNCCLLGVLENIFTFDGLIGHEICSIYAADFADLKMYEQSEFKILDSKDAGAAIWLDAKEIKNSRIYPDISTWM